MIYEEEMDAHLGMKKFCDRERVVMHVMAVIQRKSNLKLGKLLFLFPVIVSANLSR